MSEHDPLLEAAQKQKDAASARIERLRSIPTEDPFATGAILKVNGIDYERGAAGWLAMRSGTVFTWTTIRDRMGTTDQPWQVAHLRTLTPLMLASGVTS